MCLSVMKSDRQAETQLQMHLYNISVQPRKISKATFFHFDILNICFLSVNSYIYQYYYADFTGRRLGSGNGNQNEAESHVTQ